MTDTLDGQELSLHHTGRQEVTKIRHDPAARVTGLMQEVFGGR